MRKYSILLIGFIFSALFFLQIPSVLHQNTLADNPRLGPNGQGSLQHATVNCTCDNPNQMNIENKGGQVTTLKNTYTCKDAKYGITGHCVHNEEVCLQLAGNQQIPNNAGGIPPSINGSTVVQYTGIACQTTVTCECNNKNQVVCQNPVLQQTGLPRSTYTQVIADCNNSDCGNKPGSCNHTSPPNKCEQNIDFQNTNLKTVAWNQPAPGGECQVNCPCDNAGVTGTNNNGWGHTKNSACTKPDFCGNREDYCQNDDTAPGGHVCVPTVKCACSNDKKVINCSAGNGPNNATALKKGTKIDDQNETQQFDCEAMGKVCKEGPNLSHNFLSQQVPGVDCMPIGPPTPLPPPPSPPCRQWSGNGVCQTFGSAFGGFSTDPEGFIQKIFAVLLSVSGGIALLLIIKAGYQLMTAQGNPEKLNNAREQLVAAIVGLVFLIFSFVFLELIGFDILHIPGFGRAKTQTCTCVAANAGSRGGSNNTIGNGSCPNGEVQICH